MREQPTGTGTVAPERSPTHAEHKWSTAGVTETNMKIVEGGDGTQHHVEDSSLKSRKHELHFCIVFNVCLTPSVGLYMYRYVGYMWGRTCKEARISANAFPCLSFRSALKAFKGNAVKCAETRQLCMEGSYQISLASIRHHAWALCLFFTGDYIQLRGLGTITHRFFLPFFFRQVSTSAAALFKSA